MNAKRILKPTWTPADRTRHRATREAFAHCPTREELEASGDYDPIKLGFQITVLDNSPDAKLPGRERRKIYDTTQPGCGNGGHNFGDDLSEEERMAVIEYLKTL